MERLVTISDHALEEMVLAASESFALGNARQWGSVEIQGYLWGSRREVKHDMETIQYIHIDKFSISTSAWGDEDSVSVDKRVARLKNSVLTLWAPHYHFLGTFHTHPYETLEEVRVSKGWNFSDGDRETFLSDEDLWEMARPECPIMVVMAVTKIARVQDSVLKTEVDGRLEFNVGNLRFWLSIVVGEVSRSQSKTLSENILFHPFTRYVNLASSELDGVGD